ncbi:MAG: KdsC family phosphatase [Nevskiales bacterium]
MSKLALPQLKKRAAGIKLAAFDIDGVLTDGLLYLGPEGQEFKATSVKDGHGLVMLRHAGVNLAVISARPSAAMAARCVELGIEHVALGVHDKLMTLKKMLGRLKIKPEFASYMGDDMPDLPLLELCGLALTPSDAMPSVRQAADWVSRYPGGKGAVREACDMLIAARGSGKK